MVPLFLKMSNSDSQGEDSSLLQMRRLADRTATVNPESFFQRRPNTWSKFFKFYIDEFMDNNKKTYGFPDTTFSWLVQEHISNKGVLIEPSQHNLLRYRATLDVMLKLSLLVGDHVKDANRHPKSDLQGSLRLFLDAVETITHDHFELTECTVDPKTPEAHPGLAACLLWSNNGVKKTIKHHKKADVALQHPHCLYLSALRNALLHPAAGDEVRPQSVTRRIVMTGPPFNLNELLRKLFEHEHVKALAVETV